MISVLCGSNWFGVKLALDEHVSEFVQKYGELAVERVAGVDTDLAKISGVLQSVGMFQDQKMVIIYDLSLNKTLAESIEQIIGMVSGSTELIIVEGKLDKRSVYYNFLKKQSGFKEFNEMNEAQLSAWINGYVSAAGGTINRADINLLIQRVGVDQTLIGRELEKLLAYHSTINKESIELLTLQTPTSSIFNLVDQVFSGRPENALKIYDEQRSLKVEPQAIIGMLVWQMHAVAVCAAAGDKNASQISSDSGISSYVIGKAQSIARKLGPAKTQQFLNLLTDIELKSKTRTYDLDQALKYAITSLAY